MRLTVIPEDQKITLDGEALDIVFQYDSNIHAIQWYGDHGTIEYKVGGSEVFEDPVAVRPYIDLWQGRKQEIVAAEQAPPPPPTIEQLRANIDAQRDQQLAAGFTFNDALYHCDEVFSSQVQAFLLAWQVGMLPAEAVVSIRRKDNVTVQMSQSEVAALGAALMTHVQGIYAASWAAKDAL